jgi:predicted transcriptional regulator
MERKETAEELQQESHDIAKRAGRPDEEGAYSYPDWASQALQNSTRVMVEAILSRRASQKGGKARGEVVRLSVDVSPELNETLETLARKIHGSKSDVLRKAIALMEVAVGAKEDKKKFGVAAPGQTLETEIVGL